MENVCAFILTRVKKHSYFPASLFLKFLIISFDGRHRFALAFLPSNNLMREFFFFSWMNSEFLFHIGVHVTVDVTSVVYVKLMLDPMMTSWSDKDPSILIPSVVLSP